MKEKVEDVLKSFGFKIISGKGINGWLGILDPDREYIFCKCNKQVDDLDEESSKKKELILRFTIENGKIGFAYNTGGTSALDIRTTIEDLIIQHITSHNLYKREELLKLKEKHKEEAKQMSIFDFM